MVGRGVSDEIDSSLDENDRGENVPASVMPYKGINMVKKVRNNTKKRKNKTETSTKNENKKQRINRITSSRVSKVEDISRTSPITIHT